MGHYDKALMSLAAVQHCAVSRSQLLEIGSPDALQRRLASGVVQRVYQCAYRVTAVPTSWSQRLMLATMAGGKVSPVSFRAGAQMWSLPTGLETVEVTSPRHRRTRHDGIVVHESRYLTDLDVTYVDNIPVTRPARTICDLGGLVELGSMTADDLDLTMHEAVRRNLTDVGAVWREWERLGRTLRLGGSAIERLLDTFTPPVRSTDSTAETRLLALIRAAGLPEPTPQHRVFVSPTQWFDLDLAWVPVKRYVEFDPYKWHGARDKYQRDARRRLLLRRAGWDGVSITDDELDEGAQLAIAVVRDMLRLVATG